MLGGFIAALSGVQSGLRHMTGGQGPEFRSFRFRRPHRVALQAKDPAAWLGWLEYTLLRRLDALEGEGEGEAMAAGD